MAIGLAPPNYAAASVASLHSHPSSAKLPAARYRLYSSSRSRTVSDSSPPPKKTTSTLQGAPPEPKAAVIAEPAEGADSKQSIGVEPSVSDPVALLRFGSLRDGPGLEILSITLPAALALAADPITSLVDTAFVGHIGSVKLAGVAVSVSVFNLVSKLFNVPLLNITTSFVAEEQAFDDKGNDFVMGQDNGVSSEHHKKSFFPQYQLL